MWNWIGDDFEGTFCLDCFCQIIMKQLSILLLCLFGWIQAARTPFQWDKNKATTETNINTNSLQFFVLISLWLRSALCSKDSLRASRMRSWPLKATATWDCQQQLMIASKPRALTNTRHAHQGCRTPLQLQAQCVVQLSVEQGLIGGTKTGNIVCQCLKFDKTCASAVLCTNTVAPQHPTTHIAPSTLLFQFWIGKHPWTRKGFASPTRSTPTLLKWRVFVGRHTNQAST